MGGDEQHLQPGAVGKAFANETPESHAVEAGHHQIRNHHGDLVIHVDPGERVATGFDGHADEADVGKHFFDVGACSRIVVDDQDFLRHFHWILLVFACPAGPEPPATRAVRNRFVSER